MNTLFYKFDEILYPKKNGYIFQYLSRRKLSNICHYHDFYEMIYITNGECEQKVNGEKIYMKKDDILFLPPMVSHVFLKQTDNVKIVSLSVKKEEFEHVLKLYSSKSVDDFFDGNQTILCSSDRTISGLNNFLFLYDENDCRLLLCSMINMYLHASKDRDKIPKNLVRAIAEMKKPDNLKSGIPAFTRISNYSQSHLAKLMKRYFNMNIHDYILHLRLEKAYEDIVFTKENLEKISENVGYASFSHFNKIFKEKYNITPAALRKQHNLWTI